MCAVWYAMVCFMGVREHCTITHSLQFPGEVCRHERRAAESGADSGVWLQYCSFTVIEKVKDEVTHIASYRICSLRVATTAIDPRPVHLHL
ncbi:hypothetical protein EVAR_25467_1 [Eumeta japonica]|uniref:Uncharacterized protein n=1 Tax=Eumeta variegata TaxID=151549 RepID=A0A4C1VP50_EUMVA|nr:hypothetical protein EVAR_25467_1 [Eumeta japonica]